MKHNHPDTGRESDDKTFQMVLLSHGAFVFDEGEVVIALAEASFSLYTEEEYAKEESERTVMQSNLNSGSDTTAFYFHGIMLTGLAGAGLVMRMRRRDVA